MSKITNLREQTYQEAIKMLKQTNRCVIIRPTGFGKTGILTRILSDFNKTIYVYPAEIIKQSVLLFYYGSPEKIPKDETIPGVTFLSYQKLSILGNNPEKYKKTIRKLATDYDLFIFDECHKLGAPGTSKGLDCILTVNPNLPLLGATATPERMDLVDEIARYFNDCIISEYNLHHAFQDNILIRPIYYYCNYKESQTEKEDLLKEAKKELLSVKATTDPAKYRKMEARIIEAANIHEMPEAIRTVCTDYTDNTDYMRFIAFFRTHDKTRDRGQQICQWIREAFPDHKINTITVSSETEETRKNVQKLKNLFPQEKTIDLILACDMMNLGYHVNDLTGIFMYRGTESGIIYTQQIGRILSSGTDKAGICFDIVDNIHTTSLYQVLGKKSAHLQYKEKRSKTLLIKKQKYKASLFLQTHPDTPAEDLFLQFPDLTEKDIQTVINNPNACEWSESDQKELQNLTTKTRKYANGTVTEKDLDVISIQASYRDLIRKTVAEAKSMRCRQAWARWLEQGGIDKAENGVPLSRKEVLAQMPPEHIPLPPFCYSKQVSVEAVLDEMGVLE